ncbi:hypothetical protein Dimus_028061 [Dionaea muscipula]
MVVMSAFICGSNSLPHDHQDDDHEDDHVSAMIHRTTSWSSPRKSSTRITSRRKDGKNPYSSRGLDKFSALLAEIEEKRQKIYAENDPEEISLVRFVYSDDNSLKPLVVKQAAANKKMMIGSTEPPSTSSSSSSSSSKTSRSNSGRLDHNYVQSTADPDPDPAAVRIWKNPLRIWKLEMLKRPCCYWPAIVIMILLLLAVFGRSGAILCTSIGWYLLPTITNANSCSITKKKKNKNNKGAGGGGGGGGYYY